MKCRILMFTRFPVPGKTKTRLIPSLGEEGAARLHTQLSRLIFAQTRRLHDQYNIQTTVYYSDGSAAEMEEFLGSADYRPQCDGDLGLRMASAFRETFDQGLEAAVLIGSDIPLLTMEILHEAAQLLHEKDVVIGPSRDGGYYLVGCKAQSGKGLLKLLFSDMQWSTATVFKTTMQRLQENGYSSAILEELTDIDTLKDLEMINLRTLL